MGLGTSSPVGSRGLGSRHGSSRDQRQFWWAIQIPSETGSRWEGGLQQKQNIIQLRVKRNLYRVSNLTAEGTDDKRGRSRRGRGSV